MNSVQSLGVYGKLPSYGDFVHRNLPAKFINVWDEWLQQFVAGSQERIGEQWLDIYLTSPIWRFALSSGIVDENHWVGIVLPSVDQVGRYYPFSIAIPVSAEANPLEFISVNSRWFEQLEELALLALGGEITLDELVAQTELQQSLFSMAYRKTGQQGVGHDQQITFQFSEELPSNVYAHILDNLLTQNMNCYSVWSTSGSENIAPCLVTTQGLPSTNQIPAMMDGHWAHWGWPQPYTSNQ